MIVVSIVAVLIGVVVVVAVMRNQDQNAKIAEQNAKNKEAAARKSEPDKPASKPTGRVDLFEGAADGGGKPAAKPVSRLPSTDEPPLKPTPGTPAKPTPATPVKPAAVAPSTPSPASPTTPPATPTPEEGMDMRKPATPAAKPATPDGPPPEEGMDMRKPATPPASAPAQKDAENLDPVAANQWKTMEELADRPGKESYAVLRFEDFRKMNPGRYDEKLDAFIDKKMDRIWWERIDQLFKKMERLDADMIKVRKEIIDVNDPAEKKKMVDSFETMKKDKESANKTLRQTMGYEAEKPPNLDSEAELSEASKKRSKQLYDNWKRITLTYIKANQGRLLWMNDN